MEQSATKLPGTVSETIQLEPWLTRFIVNWLVRNLGVEGKPERRRRRRHHATADVAVVPSKRGRR